MSSAQFLTDRSNLSQSQIAFSRYEELQMNRRESILMPQNNGLDSDLLFQQSVYNYDYHDDSHYNSYLVNDKSHGYGHNSHNSYGYNNYSYDCCPLVVDNLTFIAIMSFLALATYFLNGIIATSNLMMAGKKKRSSDGLLIDIIREGKSIAQ